MGTDNLDPNTSRPFGDHGTAQDAIDFLLTSAQAPGEETAFLHAWSEGSAWEEWPDYYEWLNARPAPKERVLTNGERIGEVGPLRQFTVIAEHGADLWVLARNGSFAGERLTFRADTLRPL